MMACLRPEILDNLIPEPAANIRLVLPSLKCFLKKLNISDYTVTECNGGEFLTSRKSMPVVNPTIKNTEATTLGRANGNFLKKTGGSLPNQLR